MTSFYRNYHNKIKNFSLSLFFLLIISNYLILDQLKNNRYFRLLSNIEPCSSDRPTADEFGLP